MTQEFLTLIETLCAAFRKEATEPLYMAYWHGLSDLRTKDVKRSVITAMRDCKFMPSVRELRDLCGVMSTEDQAELAFDELSKNLTAYSSVDFEDKAINATVRHLGGMLRVCDMTESEFQWYRKDFVKVYQVYLRRGVGVEAGEAILGIFDTTNGTKQPAAISAEYNTEQSKLIPEATVVLKSP